MKCNLLVNRERKECVLFVQTYSNQEIQLQLTNRATHLCKCNGVADPQEHAPSPHVDTLNLVVLRQQVYRLSTSKGEPPNCAALAPAPWVGGVPDPLQPRPSLTWIIMPNLIAVVKVRAYVWRMEIRRKSGLLASRLSRSLKVIGTDTNRSATYDFLLSNHGPVFCFQDIAKYWPKFCELRVSPTQLLFNVPVAEFT